MAHLFTNLQGVQCNRITFDDKDTERAECIVGMPFVGKSKVYIICH